MVAPQVPSVGPYMLYSCFTEAQRSQTACGTGSPTKYTCNVSELVSVEQVIGAYPFQPLKLVGIKQSGKRRR